MKHKLQPKRFRLFFGSKVVAQGLVHELNLWKDSPVYFVDSGAVMDSLGPNKLQITYTPEPRAKKPQRRKAAK